MALVEVSVIPLGTLTSSVSQYIARAVKLLEGERDIKYELTAMGTILEGDLERVLTLARKMHEAVFNAEIMRVVTTIKIDDRRDRTSSMDSKMESLRRELRH
jgi:uncharacterized protein (TIGR00106 family)